MLDEELFIKMFSVVYYGLTIRNYIVPPIDEDVNPDLLAYNVQRARDCEEEEEEEEEEENNNEIIFNVPE